MEQINKQIESIKVALQLLKSTNEISQVGVDSMLLGLKGLQDLVKNTTTPDIRDLLFSREEMLRIARSRINSHFLTDYKTHDEIMANTETGSAMLGFIKCWEWMKQ